MKKKYVGSIGGFYRCFDISICCSSSTDKNRVPWNSDNDRTSYSIITCEECGNQYTTEDAWWYEGEERIEVFWEWRLEDYPESV